MLILFGKHSTSNNNNNANHDHERIFAAFRQRKMHFVSVCCVIDRAANRSAQHSSIRISSNSKSVQAVRTRGARGCVDGAGAVDEMYSRSRTPPADPATRVDPAWVGFEPHLETIMRTASILSWSRRRPQSPLSTGRLRPSVLFVRSSAHFPWPHLHPKSALASPQDKNELTPLMAFVAVHVLAAAAVPVSVLREAYGAFAWPYNDMSVVLVWS